ncbi:hypothetical protein [Azospirillum endophyticum]
MLQGARSGLSKSLCGPLMASSNMSEKFSARQRSHEITLFGTFFEAQTRNLNTSKKLILHFLVFW